MKFKEKILVGILIGGGLLFFSFAIFPLQDTNEQVEGPITYLRTDDPISFSSLSLEIIDSTGNIVANENPFLARSKDEEYLILYLVPANPCSNCMSEVGEYVELLKSAEDKGFKINQFVWFHATSRVYAEQFAKITDFPISRTFSLTKEITQEFLSFGDNNMDRQLILLDIKNQKIVFRVILPNGQLTPLHQKQSILSEAFTQFDGFY